MAAHEARRARRRLKVDLEGEWEAVAGGKDFCSYLRGTGVAVHVIAAGELQMPHQTSVERGCALQT